ncbi:MAG: DUF6110 family protein [Lachnospiraceae bacterium]|nr:DUF6110 family protein [Lachnospiraceae bacterium]
MKLNKNKIGLFALGTLFGLEGIKLLSSKDAKKVYTHATAAVLRGKDSVLDQVTVLRENCSDIYADAVEMNEERKSKEADAEIGEWMADTDEDSDKA